MEDVGIFYVHLVHVCYGYLVQIVDIWYILWLFYIFYGYLVYFSPFGYFTKKNLATLRVTLS
jgi:hypothetical protein